MGTCQGGDRGDVGGGDRCGSCRAQRGVPGRRQLDRRGLGQRGEDLAADLLTGLGMEILVRNWRSPARELPGELDIVARDGPTLVVCEVKARNGEGYGSGADAVDRRKARRLRMLARVWLSEQPDSYPTVRFDVVSVDVSGAAPRLHHYRDAL